MLADGRPVDTAELLAEILHVVGFHWESLAGVDVRLREVNALSMGGLAELDVLVHEPSELQEIMATGISRHLVEHRGRSTHLLQNHFSFFLVVDNITHEDILHRVVPVGIRGLHHEATLLAWPRKVEDERLTEILVQLKFSDLDLEPEGPFDGADPDT